MDEEDIVEIIKNRNTTIGSDGVAMAPYGVLGKVNIHPRCYGTFSRVLGRYVRNRRILSLEEAIRKMTSFPAERVGLINKGLIKKGFDADLVIFDFERIIDRSTYSNPHRYPDGIEYVIVNGEIVISEGKHLGSFPGKVIRKKAIK